METSIEPTPRREVYCQEALLWLREHTVIEGTCAITSLPDLSEVPLSLSNWRAWFIGAARRVIEHVPPESAAIFFQSDIKKEGHWIDKGGLIVRAAEEAGAHLMFHKIICRLPAGTLTYGRPAYTHMIAVSKAFSCPSVLPIPDVITDPGRQPWVRAMGVRAAAHAIRFARDQLKARTVFDPFCGVGTVLAVANALGLDAIGVDLSRKRCAQARVLTVNQNEL